MADLSNSAMLILLVILCPLLLLVVALVALNWSEQEQLGHLSKKRRPRNRV